MDERLTISLTTLLTGFAVVFAVLLLLIGIIKLYGTIVYNLQNKKRVKKMNRNADLPKAERDEEPEEAPVYAAEAQEQDDELIAVISAAVYSVYSPSEVRIKRIRRAHDRMSAWRNAGLSDNVRPF